MECEVSLKFVYRKNPLLISSVSRGKIIAHIVSLPLETVGDVMIINYLFKKRVKYFFNVHHIAKMKKQSTARK